MGVVHDALRRDLVRLQSALGSAPPPAERLRQTATRYRSDAGDQPRADFRDAVSGLRQALLPHLRGEEDEAMPLVAAVLTEAEWRRWDQANNVKGTAPPTDGGPHPRSAETSVRKRFTPISYLTPWRIL